MKGLIQKILEEANPEDPMIFHNLPVATKSSHSRGAIGFAHGYTFMQLAISSSYYFQCRSQL